MNKSAAIKMILGLAAASSIVLTGCSVGVSEEVQDKNAQQVSAQQDAQEQNLGSEETQGTSGDSTVSEPPEETAASDPESGEDHQTADTEESAAPDLESGQAGQEDDMQDQEPILSVTTGVFVEDDKDATMTIDMLGAKREGKFVKVVYGYTLHTTAEDENELNLWKVAGNEHIVREYAIDQENLNKHERLNTNALTNSGVYLNPERRVYSTSVFAAPPKDVTKMDFNLWNGTQLAQGVEID